MTPSPSPAPTERERSPGRTFFWVGGIMVAVAMLLVVGGFLLPFLAFPFETFADPDAVPDPDTFADAFGGVAVGVGAVFAGFGAGVVGTGLLIAGLVRHSRWRSAVARPAGVGPGPAPGWRGADPPSAPDHRRDHGPPPPPPAPPQS